MELTFAPRGIVQVDDARIIYRNFSGREGTYNKAGDRSFCLIIDDQEIANQLIEEGFNVKIKESREEGGDPFMYLQVKVKYHPKGSEFERLNPTAVLISGRNRIALDAESINILDGIDISRIDMDISGSNYNVLGREGKSAYLKKIYVTQEEDRFATRYAEEEWPQE